MSARDMNVPLSGSDQDETAVAAGRQRLQWLPVASDQVETAAFQRAMTASFGPDTHNHMRWKEAVAGDEIAKRMIPFHYYGKWALPDLVALSRKTGYLDLAERQLVLPEEGLYVGFDELKGHERYGFACGTPTLVCSRIPYFVWGLLPTGRYDRKGRPVEKKITITPIRMNIPHFVDIAPMIFTMNGEDMIRGQLRNFKSAVAWAALLFAVKEIVLPLILWGLGRHVGKACARKFRVGDGGPCDLAGWAVGTLAGYLMALALVDISAWWQYNETSTLKMFCPGCLDWGRGDKQELVSRQLDKFDEENRQNIVLSASVEQETIRFEHGRAGMRIEMGRVLEVERASPAHQRGVRVGWMIRDCPAADLADGDVHIRGNDGDVHIRRNSAEVAFTRERLQKLPVQYRLHRESHAIPLKHALLVREPGDACFKHILLLEPSVYGTLKRCRGCRRRFDDEPSCMDYLLNDKGGLSTMFWVDVEDGAGAHIATIEIHPIDVNIGCSPCVPNLAENIDAQFMDMNNIMSQLPQGQPRGRHQLLLGCSTCRLCYKFRIVVYFLLTWLVWLVPEILYDRSPRIFSAALDPLVGLLPCLVSAVASLLLDRFCRFRDIHLQPNVPSPAPRTGAAPWEQGRAPAEIDTTLADMA